MQIDVTLVFERSWRVGSGQAAGRHLDDLVRSDGLGLPFVPGSTLRGIVADAIRRIARALGIDVCDGTLTRREGEPLGRLCGVTRKGPPCPLCVLAGSNHREGSVAFEPARLVIEGSNGPLATPEERRQLGKVAVAVPGLLTRHRARTAIDERTGRAEEEHLFALEEAVAGLELAASLRFDSAASDLGPLHVALLVAGLRFLREIGGGRRRGLGTCRARIDDVDLQPFFGSWEEAVESLRNVAGLKEAAKVVGARAPREPKPGLKPTAVRALPRLLALDALVVGELALGGRPDAGNLVPGLPFVPGSTFRGALAARWRGDRGAEEFHRVFVAGGVRFGYLHPCAGQVAGLPVSLARHTCKLQPGETFVGHGFVDLLEEPDAVHCPQSGCPGRLVPWNRGFRGVSEEAGQALLVSPHNRIEFGSQTVREGSLFSYEVLPEGRRLRGYLRAESAEEMALLLDGLGLAVGEAFRLRVGRRRGALGYLECVLAPYAGQDGGVGLFPEAPELPGRWPEGTALRIDLLTPAILVDSCLSYRESVTPRDLGLARERFDGAYARSQLVSGWNSAHRLPKADEVAVRAGSSYLLRRLPSGADDELRVLAAAAKDGIGRRRTEGFGALSITTVVEHRSQEVGT